MATSRGARAQEAIAGGEGHGIVIVGGGICGLATALALHRKGLRSLVLEKYDCLREEGGAIGINSNGWRALDQLGVATELRDKAVPLKEIRDESLHKRKSSSITVSGELRCLRRWDLIEALASHLPAGTIRFGCQVSEVSVHSTSLPRLTTSDGSIIRAKMLIGCDGSNSVVAKFLGLHPPSMLPLWITRGFTTYPNGHPFDNDLIRIESKDVIVGRIPITDSLVSFFLTHLHPPEGSVVNKDRQFIREYALDSVKEYPSEIVELVKNSDIDTLTLSKIWYRTPWHLLFAKRQEGTVTLVGDSLHVMGPFLGQGGSAGLEDTIVLARALSIALPHGFDGMPDGDDQEILRKIKGAIGMYVRERRLRILRLSTQTYLIGCLVTPEPWFKKAIARTNLTESDSWELRGAVDLSNASEDTREKLRLASKVSEAIALDVFAKNRWQRNNRLCI